jgi:minor extracellular serine protease Vpr
MRSRPMQLPQRSATLHQARHAGSPRQRLIACAAAVLFAVSAMPVSALAAVRDTTSATRPTEDRAYAIVQLVGEPLASASATKPAKGKKVDFNNSATKSYRAQLSALRNDYKQWLRANVPGARVTGEFDLALNAVSVELNGATLAQLAASPRVVSATYQGLYYKVQASATDPDLAIIRASEAWNRSSPANAGEGVRVAVVDSGIDITHPCFSASGYPAQQQIGDQRFTNNKVVAAKVFNNRTVNRYTPEAIDSHGTHVSGTVACNAETPASIGGAPIAYKMSGVAPRALLGNYNVFPGTVANARSEDILNALEAAYQDGFDVANMSLGGGASGVQDLLTVAVNNLDQANMVVAVSAGNEGPGPRTVGSPGSAARALTAGASVVGHSMVSLIKSGSDSYVGVLGEFGAVQAGGLSATLAIAQPATLPALNDGCASFGSGSLNGMVALIGRGNCDFSVKMLNAQQAGAAGVIVANNRAGEPLTMAAGSTPVSIPGFFVTQADGVALSAKNGMLVTLPEKAVYQTKPGITDTVADFSSHGPTDVDFRIKPDVLAPGENVLSAIPRAYCAAPPCFAFFNGTSMASPHLAGSAAVLRAQHPTWSAAEVRSAIVNTAVRGVAKNLDGSLVSAVNTVGAGREDLLNATTASVALDPVSISFGAVPQGSGQTRGMTVTLRNLGSATTTYALKTTGSNANVAFAVNTASVTLARDASATVQVSMTLQKGAPAGDYQGFLEVNVGNVNVGHAALYLLAK